MKPYFTDSTGTIQIFHGDCREILPLVKADVVVTDPPYGIGLRNGDVDGHRSETWGSIAGDDSQAIGFEVLERFRALSVPMVAFASPWKPWPGHWRNLIAWDKGGAVGGGGDISTCLKRSWELIQATGTGDLYGPRQEAVWRHHLVPSDTFDHIAAKPVGLLVRLIRTFAPESSTILDPFMGSGTTLRAAKDLGRRAIGIEIEERYCEIAAKRLQQEVLQFS